MYLYLFIATVSRIKLDQNNFFINISNTSCLHVKDTIVVLPAATMRLYSVSLVERRAGVCSKVGAVKTTNQPESFSVIIIVCSKYDWI